MNELPLNYGEIRAVSRIIRSIMAPWHLPCPENENLKNSGVTPYLTVDIKLISAKMASLSKLSNTIRNFTVKMLRIILLR